MLALKKRTERSNSAGTLEYNPEGLHYKGKMKNKKYHGKGELRWADGRLYKGEFKNGLRHGKGTMIWPNGSKYEGEWRDDKMHGNGVLFDGKKVVFKGEFRCGEKYDLEELNSIFLEPRMEDAFWKYLSQEETRDLLFLKDWREFKKDPRFCSGRGILIWQKYLKPGSLFDLGFDPKCLEEMGKIIEQEGEDPKDLIQTSFFDDIQEAIHARLEKRFKEFKKSSEYHQCKEEIRMSALMQLNLRTQLL